MTTSASARLQRRTIGFTVSLLAVAIILLTITWVALGEEFLTMPENRKEAAEISVRLQSLRAEQDSLHTEIANLKNQVETHRADAELARTLAQELPNLQAKESRTRVERDRLSKEIVTLGSEVVGKQERVNSLIDQERKLKSEIKIQTKRSHEERKRLEEVQKELDAKLEKLVITSDVIAAKREARDRVNNELSELEQSLANKSEFWSELVVEEQTIKRRIRSLKIKSEELVASISREEDRFEKVQSDLDSARVDLESLQSERGTIKHELDRAKALLNMANTQNEAAAVRLENLTRQEAKILHQFRAMIDKVREAEQIVNATETAE